MPERSYGQFCAIARSLDHVGDRWTLLIVRELLRGQRTFASLERSLPGISPTLLSERLSGLCADGLASRSDAPRRSKAVTYELTPAGVALEPVLHALVRWGSRWMVAGPGDDHVDASWAGIALTALLDGTLTPDRQARGATATVHVRIGDETTTVRLGRGRRHVVAGRVGRSDTAVGGSFADVLAVAAGFAPIAEVDLGIDGDPTTASAALQGASPTDD